MGYGHQEYSGGQGVLLARPRRRGRQMRCGRSVDRNQEGWQYS